MTTTEQASTNKAWDLSLYDLNRTPQEAITDSTEIAVSLRSLHSELMCPICLDILKNTMTTKECLHRFCQDCIITALRSGNKECPTCRKKLVSKRSLRPDPNFDALIAIIYPSRDEYEQHQERVLAKLQQNHNHASLASSIEEGIRMQNLSRHKQKKNATDEAGGPVEKSTADPTPSPPAAEETTTTLNPSSSQEPRNKRPRLSEGNSEENESPSATTADESMEGSTSESGCTEIEIVFKPHPNEMTESHPLIRELKEDSIRYLKTTANATVDHLSKYLAMRLMIATKAGHLKADLPKALSNFCIHILTSPDQFVLVSGALTLEQASDKYCKEICPMELFYSWKKN